MPKKTKGANLSRHVKGTKQKLGKGNNKARAAEPTPKKRTSGRAAASPINEEAATNDQDSPTASASRTM